MTKRETKFAKLLPKTVEAVREAGQVLMEYWHAPREIRRKGRIDLVTSADLAVEKSLVQRLGEILPEATILAEESVAATDLNRPLNGPTWIIDPLDGTTNFAHGFPFVAISVALWDQGETHLGIVYLPVMNELFHACLGSGTRLNNEAVGVSRTTNLENALVATGFPYTVRDHLPHILAWLQVVLATTQGVRRAGSAAIDLAYTAAGRFDAFYEIQLKPWDMAAGWLLVREAGGRVTKMDNGPFDVQASSILATNGLIHENMTELLAKTKKE
ncbi:MAG TPA: inositol monophosphatase [Desulfonatronum sp.]|nr:inositol monophosphatase [Desulfonatronum sp.]